MPPPAVVPLDWSLTPDGALARWPRALPLAVSWGAPPHGLTILARPAGITEVPGDRLLERLRGLTIDTPPAPADPSPSPDTAPTPDPTPDFAAGWFVALSSDLARTLEPAGIGRADRQSGGWPDALLARVDHALVYDHASGRWWRTGMGGDLPDLPALEPVHSGFSLGALPDDRAGYAGTVRAALERIAAGEIYQANLTQPRLWSFEGSARALAAEMFCAASPWHGWAMAWDDDAGVRRAVVSASPELFLDADLRTGRVVTRPMKGTRPANADPGELRDCPKDRAELDMIVDLMRNDLGRVCRFGSVRVEAPREIERHGSGVWQATATVAGRLRDGVGVAELIEAAFPAGSVTGAPKIRARRVIDALETHDRGLYCGSLGWLSQTGRLRLNVAIRTALISGAPDPNDPWGVLDGSLGFPVGAGIVADSDPDAEARECDVKAGLIERMARVRSPDATAPA